MTRFTFNRLGRTLAVAAAVVVGAGLSAAAQDSSYIPIKVVNVYSTVFDATVTAVPKSGENGAETVTLALTAKTVDTLRLPYVKMTGVAYFAGQRHANALSIVANKSGSVTVNLPAQSYKNAEVALYTVNGKRVMSGKVSSSKAVNNISRTNIATGIYLLSVKGANSEAVTARLTHSGGGLSINAAFVGGGVADSRKMAKEAADVDMQWTVTVSAEGYKDNVFTITPVKWNNPLRTIQLDEIVNVIKSTFTDERDGTVYKTVKIKNQTWMAENLNAFTRELSGGAWCYREADSNCVKYGRLYDWATAKIACPTGWHLPTSDEWDALTTVAGGYQTAGSKLKSSTGWESYSGISSTDEYGFSALPGGGRGSATSDAGYYGKWWTASPGSYGNVVNIGMTYFQNSVSTDTYSDSHSKPQYGKSVRCVQDE
jgi:uncharacterized protein (TIGR02145 family)